jgi:hypothetical protein
MAWSTIRKATEEDVRLLQKRAEAFIERHDIPRLGILTATDALESHIGHLIEGYGVSLEEQREGRYLRRLWLAVVRRALGHRWAEGIAYGYVGFVAD